jgi:hypothetical protein
MTSAGSMFATRTSLSSNKTSPRPKIKTPPVVVVARIIGSVTTSQRNYRTGHLSKPGKWERCALTVK